MKDLRLKSEDISMAKVAEALESWIGGLSTLPRKVLLLPPDHTRSHSAAGDIVQILYRLFSPSSRVDIMPALGTHAPLSEGERIEMFGSEIPEDRFFVHDWRNDVVEIGEVPEDYVARVSGGIVRFPVKVAINRRLLDPDYELIISVGQVVPHEVVGMANYTKNVLVGCGGKDIIDKSHFLGAAYGMEEMMGRDFSPVRKVFDYAEEHFLSRLPLRYILTVTSTVERRLRLHGLFAGRHRSLFEEAVALSQQRNLNLLSSPLKKVVVYLDAGEFKSTWLGNKSIYRTRMAIADGGELIIIAPGVKQFGEDREIDGLIRKYGYVGSRRIVELSQTEEDLKNNLSAAAHLIHGSSEGRFNITYAPGGLTKDEVEGVNFNYMPLEEAMNLYNPSEMKDGFNKLENGEEVFFISNPALGLWALKDRF